MRFEKIVKEELIIDIELIKIELKRMQRKLKENRKFKYEEIRLLAEINKYVDNMIEKEEEEIN